MILMTNPADCKYLEKKGDGRPGSTWWYCNHRGAQVKPDRGLCNAADCDALTPRAAVSAPASSAAPAFAGANTPSPKEQPAMPATRQKIMWDEEASNTCPEAPAGRSLRLYCRDLIKEHGDERGYSNRLAKSLGITATSLTSALKPTRHENVAGGGRPVEDKTQPVAPIIEEPVIEEPAIEEPIIEEPIIEEPIIEEPIIEEPIIEEPATEEPVVEAPNGEDIFHALWNVRMGRPVGRPGAHVQHCVDNGWLSEDMQLTDSGRSELVRIAELRLPYLSPSSLPDMDFTSMPNSTFTEPAAAEPAAAPVPVATRAEIDELITGVAAMIEAELQADDPAAVPDVVDEIPDHQRKMAAYMRNDQVHRAHDIVVASQAPTEAIVEFLDAYDLTNKFDDFLVGWRRRSLYPAF
jgi:hypothetical protein